MKPRIITDEAKFDRWVGAKRKLPREGIEYTETLKRLIEDGARCDIVDDRAKPVFRARLDKRGELVKKIRRRD